MKKISTWSELDGLESDRYKITVDIENGCGWINPIVETEETLGEKYYDHHMYLSTHTFYESMIRSSNKLLQKFGFDVKLVHPWELDC